VPLAIVARRWEGGGDMERGREEEIQREGGGDTERGRRRYRERQEEI
jgi:hypothetical protein